MALGGTGLVPTAVHLGIRRTDIVQARILSLVICLTKPADLRCPSARLLYVRYLGRDRSCLLGSAQDEIGIEP